MPRTGKGGARTGKPGATYANRTDLPGKVLPVQTAPGQPYGAAGQQAASQRIVPMSSPVVAAAPPAQGQVPGDGQAAGGATPPPGQPPAPFSLNLPPGMPLPGSMPPLHAPTNRPGEPVTTGAPVGPGAGPEVLQPMFQHPVLAGAAVLNSLGDSAPPQVKAILASVNATLANQAAL